MGNKFETLSTHFNQNDRYTIIIPNDLLKILDYFRTPYSIFDFFTNMLNEPSL